MTNIENITYKGVEDRVENIISKIKEEFGNSSQKIIAYTKLLGDQNEILLQQGEITTSDFFNQILALEKVSTILGVYNNDRKRPLRKRAD